MTPLTHDHGPAWRARQRAEREAHGWPRLPLRYVAYVAIALLVLSVLAAGVFPTLALAGEHGGPRGYKDYCIKAETNCLPVQRAELRWSGILKGHLLLVSSWANRMAHVIEPAETDLYQTGNCTHGDCEDKALCMTEWLVGMGYQRGAFRMVKGLDEDGRPHMFLAVHTDEGVFYLDDRQVAHHTRWRGEAHSIESYDYYPPLGYSWNPVITPSTSAYALVQDKDQ